MKKGFTLLELTLVIGILLFLAGMSAAFYSRFLLQNAVDNTVAQISEDIRKAQMYALVSKNQSAWGVKYANHTLTLYQVGGNRMESFNINTNISITGLTDIQFAKITGQPTGAAVITVQAANIGLSKTVNMSSNGVVSR